MTLRDHEALIPTRWDYLQMDRLFDMVVKILLDTCKIMILDADLRVPFIPG